MLKLPTKTYFDDETHTYYFGGVERPSVTEICRPISFQRLNEVPKIIVQRAAERGTKCHELAEQYWIMGDLSGVEIEGELVPYMRQFMLWAKTYKPKPLYTELRLYSEEFCGTTDLICELDGKPIIVDYKFTSSADKKSLSVQLEGYKRLCDLNGVEIADTYYLHIRKDGYTFKAIERNAEWFDVLLKHNKFMRGEYNG